MTCERRNLTPGQEAGIKKGRVGRDQSVSSSRDSGLLLLWTLLWVGVALVIVAQALPADPNATWFAIREGARDLVWVLFVRPLGVLALGLLVLLHPRAGKSEFRRGDVDHLLVFKR